MVKAHRHLNNDGGVIEVHILPVLNVVSLSSMEQRLFIGLPCYL